MKIKNWLAKNTTSLHGKLIAVTGSTGGIGLELCRYLAELGADLVLLNRSRTKSETQKNALTNEFPNCHVICLDVDLEEISSVKYATKMLKTLPVDVLIHNAGAYSIPRRTCETGYDNVFQINFVSPYYIIRELLPLLRERRGRVIAVGSIAHNYSEIDPNDMDFSTYRAASKVYGNAKRHLMYGLAELLGEETDVSLAITHPGITFTNITAHYPKVIFAIIKHPMKVIFMKPKKAALCVLKGLFEGTGSDFWIGPRWFGVWGAPKKKALKTATTEERKEIAARAERIYQGVKKGAISS